MQNSDLVTSKRWLIVTHAKVRYGQHQACIDTQSEAPYPGFLKF